MSWRSRPNIRVLAFIWIKMAYTVCRHGYLGHSNLKLHFWSIQILVSLQYFNHILHFRSLNGCLLRNYLMIRGCLACLFRIRSLFRLPGCVFHVLHSSLRLLLQLYCQHCQFVSACKLVPLPFIVADTVAENSIASMGMTGFRLLLKRPQIHLLLCSLDLVARRNCHFYVLQRIYRRQTPPFDQVVEGSDHQVLLAWMYQSIIEWKASSILTDSQAHLKWI